MDARHTSSDGHGKESENFSSASAAPTSTGKKRSLFSRHQKERIASPSEKVDVKEADLSKAEESVVPASFTSLFRFSTKFEIVVDVLALVSAVASGAAQPLMSLLFGRLAQTFVNFGMVINEAKQGVPGAAEQIPAAAAQFRHLASNNALYLVFIGIGMFMCTYFYMYTWVYTGEVNAKRVRERYLKAVLRQDIAFFDNVGAGEVVTRIQNDTHLVQQGISEKVPLCVQYISAFFSGYIIAFVRSWRLALALLSMLPCIAISGGVMKKFISKYMQRSLNHIADGGSIAEEVISTVRTAKAFGSEKVLGGMYDAEIVKARDVNLKAAVVQGFSMSVFFFVIYAAYGLAFSFGTTLINRHEATAGQVVNVFFAIILGSISLALLAPEMQAITQAKGAAAKLFETIDRLPAIDSADPSGLTLDKAGVEGHITLEHVDFSYPSRPDVPVMKELSISFPAGKTAALVGESGSGKSTIIALVERFYDPCAGSVCLDGVDLKELNIKWLRSQIGLVSQEPVLFATTVKENVMHGLIGTKYEHATDEEKMALVRDACVKANADDFVSNLPKGYDTMVGERGFLLSGGQKQRIAIARAIISDPRILLLDEATSALDTQSEGIVQDALEKASAGRTTIAIAHRLSTIKDADCIYVLGQGGVVLEAGSHHDLLKNSDGPYSLAIAAQKLQEEEEQGLAGAKDDAGAIKTSVPVAEPLASKEDARTAAGASDARVANVHSEQTGAQQDAYTLFYLTRRMFGINRKAWPKYLLGLTCAAIIGMVYPAVGIVYAKGISAFSEPDAHTRRVQGDRDALWFFIISLVAMAAMGCQGFLFEDTAATLTAKLRSLSFKAILRQDVEFFDKDKNSTGHLTSSLSENPEKVKGLAGSTLGAILQSSACVVAGSVVGLVFLWKVALVGIACIPLLVSAGYIRLRVVGLKDEQNKAAHEESAQLACEAAASIRTVAALTREDDCYRVYSQSLDVPLMRSNRTALWSNCLFALSQSMSFLVIALVFWWGSRLVSRQEASTFQFFVVLMSTTFGAQQAGNVFNFVPDISAAKGAGSAIMRLIDAVPKIDSESDEGKIVSCRGEIRFENVHFSYPTRSGVKVLRGLSFQVHPGTNVALVGASGSGKSTVVQLLERFYDPSTGTVSLDDSRISDLNLQEYRKHIALVSQEPTLYAGTIRFNVLLGATRPASEITQLELESACRDANILDFIQSLPEGFETQVGGKGSQLSGGQKQRIAIARALVRDPKVLLLDEATSALDSNSERVVQQALDQASKGRTTIAIAHRLSTIQNADCIYFIKDGTISESGTHAQLLARRGDYYEYVQLQGLDN